MGRKGLGYTDLIQVKVTPEQKQMLEQYAQQRHLTVAELTRQQLRALLAKILSEQNAA